MSYSLEECYLYLKAEASNLTAKVKKLGVPIGKLSYQSGLLIERSEKVARNRALLSLPKSPDDWARMYLPSEAQNKNIKRPSPYERFCVAHELAHVLLYRKYGVIPRGKDEYWNFEKICDDFARQLLIPERFVNKFKSKEIDLIDWIDYVQQLSVKATIPEMHAARRVTDFYKDLHFVSLNREDCGKYRIVTTTLENRAGTNRNIGGIFGIKLENIIQNTKTCSHFQLSGHTLNISKSDKFDRNSMYDIFVNDSRSLQVDFIICLRKRKDLWI